MVSSEVPWWPHRPRRDGEHGDPVTEDRIVDTAVALLTAEGAESVSVRRIAAALDVSRATVYWWIGSRARLLALVADAVHGEIPLPAAGDPRPWSDRLLALSRDIHAVYEAHPGALAVIDEGVLAGPNTLAVLDRFLAILFDAGFDPQHAVWAWNTVMSVIVRGFEDPAIEADPWTAGFGLGQLSADAYPAVVAASTALQPGRYLNFEYALTTVVTGLSESAAARAGR
jgi:AcrR family transcriptional regulator